MDLLPLPRQERLRFIENFTRDGNLADIVQQPNFGQLNPVIVLHTKFCADGKTQLAYSAGMSLFTWAFFVEYMH